MPNNSWFIELGGRLKNDIFRRNIICNAAQSDYIKKVSRLKAECNNTDVYVCTYSFDNNDNRKTANLYSDLYFDIDGDLSTNEGYALLHDTAKKLLCLLKVKLLLQENEIKIYFSGSKGFHFIIPATIFGISPVKNLNDIYKSIVVYFKRIVSDTNDYIDTKIYDRVRLIRMVNTINSKTGLYKVQINEKQFYSFSRNDLLEYSSKPQGVIKKKVNKREESKAAYENILHLIEADKESKLNEHKKPVFIPSEKRPLLPCAIKLLKTSVQEGNRNNTLILIASSLLQAGYPKLESIEILKEWNNNNSPPLPEKEIELCALSAVKMLSDGKRYGCAAYKEYGLCNSESCSFALSIAK
jgi:DNA primase catalytic subunit